MDDMEERKEEVIIKYKEITKDILVDLLKAGRSYNNVIEGYEFNSINFDKSIDFIDIIKSAGYTYLIEGKNRFSRELFFKNCKFSIGIIFKNINFSAGIVKFTECELNAPIVFEKSILSELNFEKIWNIKELENGQICIENTEIKEYLIFQNIKINTVKIIDSTIKIVDLWTINIDSLDIQYNLIGQKMEIIRTESNYFIFKPNKKSDCNIRFDEVKVYRIWEMIMLELDKSFTFTKCYLKNCSFIETIITDALFLDCNFGDYILFDEYQLKGIEEGIKKNKESKKELSYKPIYNIYRMFEMNFDNHKDYDEAGEFHKRQFEVQLKFAKWWCYKKYILFLYKWFSDYGESYVRSLVLFVSVLIIFSGFYLASGLDIVNYANDFDNSKKSITQINCSDSVFNTDRWKYIKKSLLYSLSNTLPIRKEIESIKPSNDTTRALATIEITIQSIILTLFVIALRRKFKR